MFSSYAGLKRRKIQRQLQDEGTTHRRPPARAGGDRFGLTILQQQVGNRAVQQLLAQRQAEAKTDEAAKEVVEAGQLKIEKPEIKEYEVSGGSLAEISSQLLAPGKWYEYKYQYNPKIENGQVTQVDISIIPTIHLPRWTGPGWESASAADKLAWMEMLKLLTGKTEGVEDMLELPKPWLGVDFKKAPPEEKGPWQTMLQEMQSQEEGLTDILRRRSVVLQQRMLGQAPEQLKAIFAQFQQDAETEEKLYHQQREFGQKQEIALSNEEMVH